MIDLDHIAAHDWSATPLGELARWPRSLRSYVSMILKMPAPAIIFWGPDQTQIYNDGYATIMGPRHPQFFGAPYRECWPETYPVIYPWMQEVLAGGIKQVDSTHIMLTRHGFAEEAYFTFTFSPLYDDDENIVGIYQPVLEVTSAVLGARRAETLRAIAPTSPEAVTHAATALAANPQDVPFAVIYLWDANASGLRVAASAGLESHGITPPAAPDAVVRAFHAGEAVMLDDVPGLLGRPHAGPWPEPTAAAIALPVQRSIADPATGMIVLGISPRLRFDDDYRGFCEAVARELAVSVSSARAHAAEQDLLHREQLARREAELQKAHLVSLFSQAPTPVAVLRGPQLVIELANPLTCQLWGRRHADVIDRPLFDALPELKGQVFEGLLERVLRTGVPYVGEELAAQLQRFAAGEPEERFLTFTYAPLRDVAGAVDGVLVIAFDVTEQVRAREQVDGLRAAAEAANQAKDQFLAILGHELRNPLAPILTALELIQIREGDQAPRELAIIERHVTHMVRLVDDLLDVSRITRGKIELKRERLDVAQVIRESVAMVSPLLQARAHAVELDLAPALEVTGDRARLAQILTNLLTNAAKYTDMHGRVAITTHRTGDAVEIRVRDSGMGIPAALLPRVFDIFVQDQQASDRAQGGLGLGLTIVRTLTELHGGAVRAESEGPGKGATFTVTLPLAPAEATAPAASAMAKPVDAARPPGRRILVVDDNVDAAELLGMWFENHGHTVRIEHDARAALAAVPDFAPDLALLDIGLPVMDGNELAQRLRANAALVGLRLVAVTGYGQEVDRERSRAAGFDAHVVKPVDVRRLAALIEELFAPER